MLFFIYRKISQNFARADSPVRKSVDVAFGPDLEMQVRRFTTSISRYAGARYWVTFADLSSRSKTPFFFQVRIQGIERPFRELKFQQHNVSIAMDVGGGYNGAVRDSKRLCAGLRIQVPSRVRLCVRSHLAGFFVDLVPDIGAHSSTKGISQMGQMWISITVKLGRADDHFTLRSGHVRHAHSRGAAQFRAEEQPFHISPFPSVLVDRDSEESENVPDHDSRPCSRSFRYKFRSLIPRILAAFPR